MYKFEIGNKVIVNIRFEENINYNVKHNNEIGFVIGRQEMRTENLYKIHFINENMYKFRNRWIIGEKDLDFFTPEMEEKYSLKLSEEKKIKDELKLIHLDIDPFGEENW